MPLHPCCSLLPCSCLVVASPLPRRHLALPFACHRHHHVCRRHPTRTATAMVITIGAVGHYPYPCCCHHRPASVAAVRILGYSICESIPNIPWVSFFKKKAISFLFYEFPFIFSYIYFPTAPKIWTLVHQKLARICSSCIRLLQGEHWAVWPKLTLTGIRL